MMFAHAQRAHHVILVGTPISISATVSSLEQMSGNSGISRNWGQGWRVTKSLEGGRTKPASRAQRANDGFAEEPTPGHVQRSQQAAKHVQTWRSEQPGGREMATPNNKSSLP